MWTLNLPCDIASAFLPDQTTFRGLRLVGTRASRLQHLGDSEVWELQLVLPEMTGAMV